MTLTLKHTLNALLALALLVSLSLNLSAQTISPPNAECSSKKCVGSFTVTNDSVVPMTMEVTPVSASLSSSGATFKPLPSDVEVRLNTMSTRLSPKESYVVDYRIKCPKDCVVGFAASMLAGHTDSGVAVHVVLVHIVYADQKGKGARIRALKSAGYVQ
jgi:hypothetical protein